VKFAVVIPDGCADYPSEELGGRTPLEAAETPAMDEVARSGLVGRVRTVPDGYTPGSDVAIMSVLGYAPQEHFTGRAPLEAASMDIELGENDWAARANLVTVRDGRMADYSAGHISTPEARRLVESLNEAFSAEPIEFHAGNGYRNLLVRRGAGEVAAETTPPHDIAGQPVEEHLPRGKDAEFLKGLMERSSEVLAGHEVNAARRSRDHPEATQIWLWGGGKSTRLAPFREKFGLSAAVITAVDLVAGICRLAGWERIAVPGATGYYDTDYDGKCAAALEALGKFDLVLVHVEAPDEASHNRDAAEKVRAIERVDRRIVAPLLENLGDSFRLLVLSDHYTLLSSGAHHGEPVPFAACGEGLGPSAGGGGSGSGAEAFSESAAAGAVSGSGAKGFSEADAARGEFIERGPELMERFTGKAKQWAL